MGSRVSFPILCLANLALYLAVRRDEYILRGEVFGKSEILFEMNRVLVNGDDILFAATANEELSMRRYGAEVGLKLSVGKTYIHDVYANINSTAFHLNCNAFGSSAVEIPYLNSGLFFGQNKVLGKTDTSGDQEAVVERVAPHIAVMDNVVNGSLPGKQCEVMATYISQHREDLLRECRGRNFFISRSLGGWGVRRPLGFEYAVTSAQRCEAVRLLRSFSGGWVYDQRPLTFTQARKHEPLRVLAPWLNQGIESEGPTRLRHAKESWIGQLSRELGIHVKDVEKTDLLEHGVLAYQPPPTSDRIGIFDAVRSIDDVLYGVPLDSIPAPIIRRSAVNDRSNARIEADLVDVFQFRINIARFGERVSEKLRRMFLAKYFS